MMVVTLCWEAGNVGEEGLNPLSLMLPGQMLSPLSYWGKNMGGSSFSSSNI